MQHTCLRVILISALKVKAAVYAHITRRHSDIAVVRDIHASRVVHLIVYAGGYRE